MGKKKNEIVQETSFPENEESKENSTTNTRKRFVPQRKNRGLRMMELARQEEKLTEDDFYNNYFHGGDSDDDEFNLSENIESYEESDIPNLEEEENEDKEDNDINIEESSQTLQTESPEPPARKNRASKKEEKIIYDIDLLDIDRIDEIEDMRDRGIDVDEFEQDEELESDEEMKKKKKKKNRTKKKNVIPLLKNEEEDSNKRRTKAFIDYDEDSENLSKKRYRSNKPTTKFLHFRNKIKQERIKLNKNVSINGPKDNPYSIFINKSAIFTEEDNADDIMTYNDEGYKNNIEEEKNTQNLIKKYKKQEKTSGEKFSWIQEKPSQRDLLFEAIFTEYHNIKSLEAMQRLEDMNKRDYTTTNKRQFADFVKLKQKVPTVEDINAHPLEVKQRETYLTFSNNEYYRSIFDKFNKQPDVKEKNVCAITGGPAKYFDPLTKQYYSNIESFKILRERHFQKEEDGLLFRIQTLSDLASQKKEKLKKMILTDDQSATKPNNNAMLILNMINKFGILRNEPQDPERKVVSRNINSLTLDRIYNRNRENCLLSGMLIEANKQKIVISKKIFRDKYSSRINMGG